MFKLVLLLTAVFTIKVGKATPSKESVCTQVYPRHCAEATPHGDRRLYTIQLEGIYTTPFLVYCDFETLGDKWTVIQRRQDGSVDFYRGWKDYKNGFGNLVGEFWIGLEKLHALTTSSVQELLIKLVDYDNVTVYAKYDTFAIGDESQAYALNVLGKYTGYAGDSLEYHAGHKFTTKDVDNDIFPGNSAKVYTGGWWYNNGHQSNLNGRYLKGEYHAQFAQGINWNAYKGFQYSLKYVQMMIRPKYLD